MAESLVAQPDSSLSAAPLSVPWGTGFPLGLSLPTCVKGGLVAVFLRGIQPLWEPMAVVLGPQQWQCTNTPPAHGRWSPEPTGPSGTNWEALAECRGPHRALAVPCCLDGCWRVSAGDSWDLRLGCDMGQGGQLPGAEVDSVTALLLSWVALGYALPSLSLWWPVDWPHVGSGDG